MLLRSFDEVLFGRSPEGVPGGRHSTRFGRGPGLGRIVEVVAAISIVVALVVGAVAVAPILSGVWYALGGAGVGPQLALLKFDLNQMPDVTSVTGLPNGIRDTMVDSFDRYATARLSPTVGASRVRADISQIAAALRRHSSSLVRLHVRLDYRDQHIGISTDTSASLARLSLATRVGHLPGVDTVWVMWGIDDDNPNMDLDNTGLAITLTTSSGQVSANYQKLVTIVPQARVITVMAGDHTPVPGTNLMTWLPTVPSEHQWILQSGENPPPMPQDILDWIGQPGVTGYVVDRTDLLVRAANRAAAVTIAATRPQLPPHAQAEIYYPDPNGHLHQLP